MSAAGAEAPDPGPPKPRALREVDLGDRTHGVPSTYKAGCCCGACTRAATDYKRERRHAAPVERIRRPVPDMGWMAAAACSGADTSDFFIEGEVGLAREYCDGCPVRGACLRFALDNNERWGVWGGESVSSRRRMRPMSTQDLVGRLEDAGWPAWQITAAAGQ